MIEREKETQNVFTRNYTNNITLFCTFDREKKKWMIVTDTLKDFGNWEILDDTTTILGYKCQKAQLQYNNKVYNAYFTTAIPYSAGPINFRGLPGLILRVNIEGKESGYYATEIVNPYKGVVPKFHEEGKHISREEYNKIFKKQNE